MSSADEAQVEGRLPQAVAVFGEQVLPSIAPLYAYVMLTTSPSLSEASYLECLKIAVIVMQQGVRDSLATRMVVFATDTARPFSHVPCWP